MTVKELSEALPDKVILMKEEAKRMEGIPIKNGRFHFMYKEGKKKNENEHIQKE